VLLAACSPFVGLRGTVLSGPTNLPLRALASAKDFRIGSTAEADQTTDAPYAEVLQREFNSLTPENALKWYTVQPSDGGWNFAPADAVVAFAEDHDMEIRGHTLVWAQDTYTPAWVKAIDDPAALQAEVDEQITTVMERYRGRIARYDVVNEPLRSNGTTASTSVFWELGPDWIGEAFRTAHAVDPDAELWLNEYGTDWVAGKHDALVALVADLVADGVPIHGVGLQMHRVGTFGPNPQVLEAQLRDFTDLGLEVALTELDVRTDPADPTALETQAGAYERIVDTCLAVPGCTEVTTWGVSDGSTWLDASGLWPTPTRPLLFDAELQPKPAYHAVHALLEPPVPLVGVPVNVYPVDDPTTPIATAITNEHGFWRTRLPEGAYLVEFVTTPGWSGSWWPDQPTPESATAVTVPAEGSSVVDASLDPP
jgi:endo-1,4-beta-xylanase